MYLGIRIAGVSTILTDIKTPSYLNGHIVFVTLEVEGSVPLHIVSFRYLHLKSMCYYLLIFALCCFPRTDQAVKN